MSEEDMLILSKYENIFDNAINQNFLRVASIKELFAIYNKYHTATINSNTNCSGCVLNMVKRLGNEYLKQKKENSINKEDTKEYNKEDKLLEIDTESTIKNKNNGKGRPNKKK